MTSSKYIKHVSNLSPENVLGYYVKPKGTTVHSYSPALVTKAALPLSVSVWESAGLLSGRP